jgi:hypothetical protein
LGNANAVWITGVARECPQVILVGQLKGFFNEP